MLTVIESPTFASEVLSAEPLLAIAQNVIDNAWCDPDSTLMLALVCHHQRLAGSRIGQEVHSVAPKALPAIKLLPNSK